MKQTYLPAMLQALLAAGLFGASAPLAKVLLGTIHPVALAGFLYLGSGVGLLLLRSVMHFHGHAGEVEAPLRKDDVKWLAGAVIAGGIAAPIALLFSLPHTPAATASLLLNFEGVATTLLATSLFKEPIGRRVWWAVLCVTAASIVLSMDTTSEWGVSSGALGILAACVLWGLDNNCTRFISAKNPLTIVAIKGLSAGSFSLALALFLGVPLSTLGMTVAALLLGGLSYGVSLVLFISAMRDLGAARTSTLFGTAPLAGVALSVLLLGETLHPTFFVALFLMIVGALCLLNEKHAHVHTHELIAHEHRHRHPDPHHEHKHTVKRQGTLWHSHWHTHDRLHHEHDHLPDIHHWHLHSSGT